MKKYLGLLLLFVSFTMSAQSMADNFDVKAYAEKQTQMIKTTLNLSDTTSQELYKANLRKAYSIHKHIILFELEGKTNGKTLKQIITDVTPLAEKASGYQKALLGILGEVDYDKYKEKFM
jgi:hypothetical protein